MRFPQLVGHLRKLRVWTAVRKARRLLGPPICVAVHAVVSLLGPRLVPANLFLKHIYDHRLIYVSPIDIQLSLSAGAWRLDQGTSKLERFRSWYQRGDGWKSVRSHVTRNFHGHFMASGSWDMQAKEFDILAVVVALFEEGKRPEETTEYQRHQRNIQAGRLAWTRGCRTIEELDEYYSNLARAFEDIRTSGYRPQHELGNGTPSDEVRICINRHGDLCVFGGGTHRLSIAKLLEIDQIPVVLKRVHSAWVTSWITRAETTDPIEAIRRGVEELTSRTTSSVDETELERG